MKKEERDNIIENYGNAYELFMTALKKCPKEMWTFKPAPERWSIHQINIHLADSEVSSYQRCRRFIAEPDSKILGYDQDKWADRLFYHSQNTNDALELFRLLRKMSYDLIKNLPDEYWSRTLVHEERGIINMEWWLKIYENHIPGHIRQMESVYNDWLQFNGK